MSCKAIDHQAERRNGLSRVWKVYCYVQALVALQFPSDLVQCFVPIMYEMWKDVIRRSPNPDDFELLKVIGRGFYGKVYRVRSKMDRRLYAMKTFQKSSRSSSVGMDDVFDIFSDVMNQYELMKLDCPFLCRHYSFFQTEEKYYILIDFISGGELFFYLQPMRRFSEDRCRFYTAQLVVAVEYLHKNGIICREIKPENILLSAEGNLVLTDYYIRQDKLNLDMDRYRTFSGTPEYLAPEILQGLAWTKAVHYWGIGTLLFEMLTGLPPFYCEDVQEMYWAIIHGELVFPDYVTGAVRDLIRKLLERDVKLRTEYGEKMSSHEWFVAIDFQLLSELKIDPPYVPKSVNYDEEFDYRFTEPICTYTIDEDEAFAGFTYVADQ